MTRGRGAFVAALVATTLVAALVAGALAFSPSPGRGVPSDTLPPASGDLPARESPTSFAVAWALNMATPEWFGPTPSPTPPPTPSPTPAPPRTVSTTLMGAGDICRLSQVDAAASTAALIKARPSARVFTLGDNSNDSGTEEQYADCYGSTWGAFKSRTRPTVGNHDLMTSAGGPYYAYFGSSAGIAGSGFYSYNLPSSWHVVVLNSMCSSVGGCGPGSAQEKWLKADLAANKGKHILAMWHIPRFSSGQHGNNADYDAFWQALYEARADIVLNGHDHDYERFARQTPDGKADAGGIRQFVVGTGGAGQRSFGTIRANSEVRDSSTYGVLRLTLKSHSYAWQFVPAAGGSFRDSGETATHT
jgi:hypothetical protein